MGSLFSKSKKQPSQVTEHDKAVLQLKSQRDKLKQYQKKITAKLESERELARKLLKEGKKDRAKLLLKKKRYQEDVLAKTDAQLDNLETLVHDLEFSQVEVQVVQGLKAGNEALKKIHEVLKIEDIERILDETAEAVEKQKEIDEVLSGYVVSDEDEESLLAELDDLVKQSLPSVPGDVEPMEVELDLPEVPEEQPVPAKKEKREKEAKKAQLVAS